MSDVKNCVGCKFADWKKSSNGRLHPSGDGLCRVKIVLPELPVSMHYLPRSISIVGGFINRKHKFSLNTECAYYAKGIFVRNKDVENSK